MRQRSDMNTRTDRSDTTAETEPTAGSTQAPVWMFVMIAVLSFWGMGFLDRHAGGFNPKVYEPHKSYAEVHGMQPVSREGEVFAKGKKLFESAGCVLCHQVTGMGTPGQFPPLAGSDWVLAAKPDRIIRVAWNGLTGPIQVKGTEFNQQMANIGQALNLSAEDMAALLTFIRGNSAWGNDASPVTAEQVKPVLEQIAARQEAWTADELQKIPVQ
jgi:mono/diheme cytochrome c family protein